MIRLRRTNLLILLIVLSLGLTATLYYGRVLAACDPCADYHRAIVAGTADSPHRYRILAPLVVQAVFSPRTDVDVLIAYMNAHALVLPLMLGCLLVYWRRWIGGVGALLGVVGVVAYSPIMFEVYGISLYNVLEVCLLCAGLLWLLSGRAGVVFAALVALATINRETAVLLPLAYAALHLDKWRQPKVVLQAAGYLAVWAGVYGGLRVWLGPAPDQITVARIFAANLGGGWNTSQAVINNLIVLPVWIAAAMNWRSAPRQLQRIALVGVPYVLLLLVFALWNETRLLLPLFVFWLPLALLTPRHS
jgi:hypothetical protein